MDFVHSSSLLMWGGLLVENDVNKPDPDKVQCKLTNGKDNIAILDLNVNDTDDLEWVRNDGLYKPGYTGIHQDLIINSFTHLPSKYFDKLCTWKDASFYEALTTPEDEHLDEVEIIVSADLPNEIKTQFDHNMSHFALCEDGYSHTIPYILN